MEKTTKKVNMYTEIRKLFHLPNQLQIRRDKNGNVEQVMPAYYKGKIREEYV